jgi:hypothetical protein
MQIYITSFPGKVKLHHVFFQKKQWFDLGIRPVAKLKGTGHENPANDVP